MVKLKGLDNIFTRTETPKASTPKAKTPATTKRPASKTAKPAKTPLAPKGTKGTKTGRPVVLEQWQKVTVILEERQVKALDAAVYEYKQRTGARSSYSEVLRWLVDNHVNNYGKEK